uniref:Uncharacterized protein n=1 Tax=Sinocyclocheilus rhinocerous TaxID=307959 RepID=A0A673MM35_9TELE
IQHIKVTITFFKNVLFCQNCDSELQERSLLWRWNTLKPVGSGCRDHYECGTNFCLYCSLVHVSIN